MKKVLLLASVVLFLSQCSTTKSGVGTNPRIPAKFDFAPPSKVTPGSTNLTVALIRPIYITKEPEYYIDPFKEMSQQMANDFEELLNAKGINIRGPFGSRDEMVFNDKQSCSFAFVAEIDLQPSYNRKYTYSPGMGSIVAASYKMNGEITLGGSLVLKAVSPRYGEKLWTKSIALEKQSFTYHGSVKWNNVPSLADELKQDNEVYNPMARELETFYEKAMNLAWQQIDAEEMKTVAEQAKKADMR